MNLPAAMLPAFLILLELSPVPSNLSVTSSEYLVYSSHDQGRSWSRASTGLPKNARINALTKSGESLIAGTDAGVFISTNRARNWHSAVRNSPGPTRVVALATLTTRTNLLFAGTTEGLLLTSSDSGKTWRPNPSFPQRNIRSLHTMDGSIFAGTDADHVYQSSNGGQSWTHLTTGLPAAAQIFALTSVNRTLFAGVYAQGLYKWDPGARKWLRLGEAAHIRPLALASIGQTLIAGHNPGGIYWSDDAGTTWKRWIVESASASTGDSTTSFPSLDAIINHPTSNQSLELPIWELSAQGNFAITGAGDGVYYTIDRARTWNRVNIGLPSKAPGIAFLIQDDLILAAVQQRSCAPN